MHTSHPHAHISAVFAPNAFNFRDLSMTRASKADYFSMKPVRGSSPTASLAADLSQNFHIDMRFVMLRIRVEMPADCNSPQLPTPRRSLFTSNLFGALDARGWSAERTSRGQALTR